MKLGENGVAFFAEETADGEKVPRHLATSPPPEDLTNNNNNNINHRAKKGDSETPIKDSKKVRISHFYLKKLFDVC